MKTKDFWNFYNTRNLEEVKKASSEWNKHEFTIESATEQASWGDDFEELYFLWKLDAEEYTPTSVRSLKGLEMVKMIKH
ncbi:MAG: hypothetical protein ACO3E1_02735 [Flavobacteriales bacterium]